MPKHWPGAIPAFVVFRMASGRLTMASQGNEEMKTYPRIYAALKQCGHSPAKAIEIILDARRQDHRALHWCRVMARIHRDWRS